MEIQSSCKHCDYRGSPIKTNFYLYDKKCIRINKCRCGIIEDLLLPKFCREQIKFTGKLYDEGFLKFASFMERLDELNKLKQCWEDISKELILTAVKTMYSQETYKEK